MDFKATEPISLLTYLSKKKQKTKKTYYESGKLHFYYST